MTREEANKELERAFDVLDHTCHMDNRRKEAFNMARVALSAEPCEDCISRKQAMKACYQMAVRTGIEEMPYKYAETELAHLPSIQPKTDVLDKIRAEIKEESRFCPLTEGLDRALEIIDKYTAEKE